VEAGTAGGTSGAAFMPLTKPSIPAHGDEDNPVYSWHNNFMRVRVPLASRMVGQNRM